MNERNGIVRGFGRYTTSQLEQAKADLHLGMSTELLEIASDYYRKTERRDPLIAELRLLDELSKAQRNNPAAHAITKLLTNDRFVAETFADVMNKRRALDEEATSPCTLYDLTRIATQYLARIGKKAPLGRHLMYLQDGRTTKRAPKNGCGICVDGSRHQLYLEPIDTRAAEIQVGDVLLLFLPQSRKSTFSYPKNASAFLQSYGQNAPWKKLFEIEEGGLLPTLIQHSETGLWIELPKIPHIGLASPLAALTDLYVGNHVALLSPDQAKRIMLDAQTVGIDAIPIATATHASRMTFVDENDVIFSMESSFMRSMLTVGAATAALPDEGNSLASIIHTPTASSCAYLEGTATKKATDCRTVGDTVCAVAHCKPDASFYKNALYTALCPILSLAAAGYSYTEQSLAFGISLPTTDNGTKDCIANAVSLFLGLYRAQAELGIPAPAISIKRDDTISSPHLTVYASANGCAPAEGLHEAGNFVYCITPIFKNGIPDFDSLRDHLQKVTVHRKKQTVVSTRILCNEAITDGLTKMETDKLYCHISNQFAAEGTMPLAILIETRVPLADLSLVGKVCEKTANQAVAEEKAPVVSPIRSLIWSSRREVILLAKTDDVNAQALADAIEEKGGHATVLIADVARSGPLSRALLGAHLLILCGNVHFPMTEQTQFALDTMQRAGGACWIVGRTEYSVLADRATMFRRIPESALDTILHN